MNLAARMGAFYVDAYVVSYTPAASKGISLAAVSSWAGDNEISSVQVVTPDSFVSKSLIKTCKRF